MTPAPASMSNHPCSSAVPNCQPTATPIFQTATFVQDSASAFGQYDYSRTANPTREVLESTLAQLENGRFGFAFASGMAAIATVLRFVKPGQTIIAGDDLYGGTNRILIDIAEPMGIRVLFVDLTNTEEIRNSLDDTVQLVLIETPTNPLQRIVDIEQVCSIVHERISDCIVAVDNTMLSPYLQQPLTLGADIVIQSATKWLCGHGDVTAGALITNEELLAERIAFIQNAEGNALGPQDCFLLLRGMKTLGIRVDRQEANARAIAEFLDHHPAIRQVHYAGLPTHPGFEIQNRQARGAGAVVSFETHSRAVSESIVESLQLFSITVSFGSVHSTASLPCAMSHASIPKEIRDKRALPSDLIRLSVGIEDVNDLIADLSQAIQRAQSDQEPTIETSEIAQSWASKVIERDTLSSVVG